MNTVFENDRVKVEVLNYWQVVITDKRFDETKVTVSADGGGLYAESTSPYTRAGHHGHSAYLRVSSGEN